MDTGSYMANQMDDMITSGLHERDAFEEKLIDDMAAFIKECGYTWKTGDVIAEYRDKFKNGEYVSHTCKQIILKFQDRLKKLYQ